MRPAIDPRHSLRRSCRALRHLSFVPFLLLAGGCEIESDQGAEARHLRVNDLFDELLRQDRRSTTIPCPCEGLARPGECEDGGCAPPGPNELAACIERHTTIHNGYAYRATMDCMRSSYHVEPITGEAALTCGVLAYTLRNDCLEAAGCDPTEQESCDADFAERSTACPSMAESAFDYFDRCLEQEPARQSNDLPGLEP